MTIAKPLDSIRHLDVITEYFQLQDLPPTLNDTLANPELLDRGIPTELSSTRCVSTERNRLRLCVAAVRIGLCCADGRRRATYES